MPVTNPQDTVGLAGDHCQGRFWTNYFVLEYAVKGSVQRNIDPTHYAGYDPQMYNEEFESAKNGESEGA